VGEGEEMAFPLQDSVVKNLKTVNVIPKGIRILQIVVI
jgi:hypothetical protein